MLDWQISNQIEALQGSSPVHSQRRGSLASGLLVNIQQSVLVIAHSARVLQGEQ